MPVSGACEAVMKAAGHVGNVATLEAVDDPGRRDVQVVGVIGDPCLTKVVETPGPDGALGIDGEAVVEAGEDADDRSLGQGDGARHERFGPVPLPQARPAAQLGLLAAAPGIDDVVVGQGEDVVEACGQLLDVPDAGYLDWRWLETLLASRAVAAMRLLEEAQGPVVVLHQVSHVARPGPSAQRTQKVSQPYTRPVAARTNMALSVATTWVTTRQGVGLVVSRPRALESLTPQVSTRPSCQRRAVHAPDGELDDADRDGVEETVDARTLGQGGIAAVVRKRTEPELAAFTGAEDEDAEPRGWRLVGYDGLGPSLARPGLVRFSVELVDATPFLRMGF